MAAGTKEDPWELKTPPGTSSYTMYRDEQADPPSLVCQVGSTTLKYRLRAIEDLHAWLKARGDWVPLGAADEKKPAADGTVEAWGRSADNPVGGWYGLRSGYRGRFGMYLPPLLEELGLAEVSHDARKYIHWVRSLPACQSASARRHPASRAILPDAAMARALGYHSVGMKPVTALVGGGVARAPVYAPTSTKTCARMLRRPAMGNAR